MSEWKSLKELSEEVGEQRPFVAVESTANIEFEIKFVSINPLRVYGWNALIGSVSFYSLDTKIWKLARPLPTVDEELAEIKYSLNYRLAQVKEIESKIESLTFLNNNKESALKVIDALGKVADPLDEDAVHRFKFIINYASLRRKCQEESLSYEKYFVERLKKMLETGVIEDKDRPALVKRDSRD